MEGIVVISVAAADASVVVFGISVSENKIVSS